MKLTVSYHHLYHDWYVGEMYIKFFDFLNSIDGIEIEYKHLNELADKYKLNSDYNNGFPSIFSPYNLLIINEENNKTFVHSWHDYAPAILLNGSGIENFDVSLFACVSRLDNDFLSTYNGGIKIQPSVYILESTTDLNFIDKFKDTEKIIDKVYFNALSYGVRGRYIDVLSNSDKFNVTKKDGGGWLPKDKYFEEMSKHKFGLNLDGVAKICYRDLELFGLNTLLVREKLDILTYEPIEVDKHYVNLIDDDIKSKINDDTQINYIIEKLEDGLNNIIDSGQYEYIINEARGWYERNTLPDNQIKILYSFLEDFEIFK